MSQRARGSEGSSFDEVEVRVGARASAEALTPDVRRGDHGIFAGDWAWYEPSGARRQPIGFVGVLIDTWDGWAVFGCGRDVAEAVVAQHRHEMVCERARLRALGFSGRDLEARFAASTIGMWFDGDDIMIDERAFCADRHAITRLSADEHGLYVIRGYVWPWTCVDPAVCGRIVGRWPVR